MSEAAGINCPFCWHPQVGHDDPIWRCDGCNLHLRASDLIDAATRSEEDSSLDAVHRHYCPWCAYPVGFEYSIPEDGEFPCPGCAGSLSGDLLETQAAIEAYRKKELPASGHLAFLVVLVVILGGIVLLISTR